MKLNKTEKIAMLSVIYRLEAAGELMRHERHGELKSLVEKVEPKIMFLLEYIKHETGLGKDKGNEKPV